MHTTPDNSTEPTLRDLKQVMTRVQIKALETLERLMEDQELTGNEKIDKAKATERNRQRMSATQTLIHCRTMQRELREKREQSHRIKQDERAAQSKAPHQLATLRRLHKLNPDEYDNPDASSAGDIAMQRMAMPPESSDDRNSSCATGRLPASAGPNEPEPGTDHSSQSNLNQAETPTASHWPASGQWHTEPAKPVPTPPRKRLTSFQIADAERKRQTRERIMAKHEAKVRPKNR